MKKNISRILINALPILLMMGLIPLVPNDYVLCCIYILVIAFSFLLYKQKHEFTIFLFGFIVMILAEMIFVSTGVETFTRNTLLGLMPVWLPFLWGYSFVAIKRAILILNL